MAIEVRCPSCDKLLRVKDSAAGKTGKCPHCGGKVAVPDAGYAEEYDAEEYQDDDAASSGDAGDEDSYGLAGSYEEEPMEDAAVLPPERRPCPACGEMIMLNAAKCRYCGEIFDATLKKQKKKAKSGERDADADLSAGEWVVAILCGTIGCIVGIVYMIQGKPKGLKMVGISLLFSLIWGAINAALQMANNPPP